MLFYFISYNFFLFLFYFFQCLYFLLVNRFSWLKDGIVNTSPAYIESFPALGFIFSLPTDS